MKIRDRHFMDAGRCSECRHTPTLEESKYVIEVDMTTIIFRMCPKCAIQLQRLLDERSRKESE